VFEEEEKLQKQSADPRTVEEVAEEIELLQKKSNELGMQPGRGERRGERGERREGRGER
jgi:hypothetical protein